MTDPAPTSDLYQPWAYTQGMHDAARNNETPGNPALNLRDSLSQNPHLRVIAPCVIHAGQTIDIDLTTGTVTVKDTP